VVDAAVCPVGFSVALGLPLSRPKWFPFIPALTCWLWNGDRCPLSDLAARFTDNRANNFPIYLPHWLAEHNKVIGALFVAGEWVVLGCWLWQRLAASSGQANPSPQKVAKRS
jgi:hypothetical protein